MAFISTASKSLSIKDSVLPREHRSVEDHGIETLRDLGGASVPVVGYTCPCCLCVFWQRDGCGRPEECSLWITLAGFMGTNRPYSLGEKQRDGQFKMAVWSGGKSVMGRTFLFVLSETCYIRPLACCF